MKTRNIIIHFLGGLIVLSSVYHSEHNFLSLILIAPISLSSLGIHLDKPELYLSGLVATSLIGPLLLAQHGMEDIVTLTIFVFTFLLPLLIYWGVVLSEKISFDLLAALTAAFYILACLLLFYFLIFMTNVNEYLLSIGNKAPQTLVLIASALIVYIPIHALTYFNRD